ncbi:glycosyltransferase, partial [bacterium]|nr:glycosyltransferase [bacterium]
MTDTQSYPKIRIAFVLWTLETMGGSEHVVFDIVRKLDQNQFEIIVIGLSDGPVRKRYENIGVKVETVSKKSKFDFNFVQKFRRILVSNKIEIVNPHHYYPLLYTSLSSVFTGIKIVYTEHSVWQYLELGLVKKMISNLLLAKADAVVAISRQLLEYYRCNPFVSGRKTHLIIN